MALTDKLSAIAEAIRSKTGDTKLLTLDEIAETVSASLEPVRFPNKIELAYPNVTLSGNQLAKIIYCDGVWFTAYGNDIYTSIDGINWEHSTVDLSMGYVCRLYANGVLVNCAGANNSLYYSTDKGKTWAACNTDSSLIFTGLSHCNGHWYTRCITDKVLYHSIDGKNWEALSIPFASGSINYANGVYMVVDPANKALWRSADGINFTEVTGIPSELAYGADVAYFNGLWFGFDSRSQKSCYSMDNGDTWTLLENCPVHYFECQFGYRAIGCSKSTNKYYVSDDGLTWSEIESLSDKNISNIFVVNNVCYARTSTSLFYYSLDLQTWHEGELPDGLKNINIIGSDGNVLMVAGKNSSSTQTVLYSKLI